MDHMDTPPESALQLLSLYDKYYMLSEPSLQYSRIPSKQDADMILANFSIALDELFGAGRPDDRGMCDVAELEVVKELLRMKLYKSIDGFGVREAGTQTINQNQRVEEIHRNQRKHRFLPW